MINTLQNYGKVDLGIRTRIRDKLTVLESSQACPKMSFYAYGPSVMLEFSRMKLEII